MSDSIVPFDEGSIVEVPEPITADTGSDPFHGVSVEPVPAETQAHLDRELDPEEVDVKEDGTVYLGAHVYRARLNKAFGAMGWGLVPVGDPVRDGNKVYYRGRLYCHDRFVAESMGEHTYYASGGSWADSVDSAATECLKKCCKNLISGFLPMWDKGWTERWRRQYCVKVKLKPRQGKSRTWGWRRRDRDPLPHEDGIFSPNQPVKQRGDGQSMREEFGLPRQEVDPAAVEARRTRFTELLMAAGPLPLERIEEIIGLADDRDQLQNGDLVSKCELLADADKLQAQSMWKQRWVELGESE